MIGIMLSSCGELRYGIQKTIYEAEEEKIFKDKWKKNGSRAYEQDNEVFNIVKDVTKRSINKRVQFGEISVLIPENTELNSKIGNIVDLKTGYGLPITFYIKDECNVFSNKVKTKNKKYFITYLSESENVRILFEKISKINGFTRTCN
ncbi:hypothetical protein EII29_11300 [Leptotrichia sp. OH3620_COT-345]|nr:hypothetical protein EII29_11300 [Leptotrichia sp. OH3620_COT-345]